jgi:hypothetical protein
VKTLIFFTALNWPTPTDFLEFALSHTDALTPSRTFYLQALSGSYDVTSAFNPTLPGQGQKRASFAFTPYYSKKS